MARLFYSLLCRDDAPSIDKIDDTKFEAGILADILNEEISLSEVLSSIKQQTQQALARFRSSSHKLGTEVGCYHNINRADRICTFCYNHSDSMHVEDEFHVFFIFQNLTNFVRTSQDQDQDSLLVKRRNDNHSPGPVIRELVPSSHQRSELSNTILYIFSG